MTSVVQVRMKENTIEQVDKLQKIVHAPSRSDAIRRAVEISDVLVNAVSHGDKVIIESKDGKQRQVLIAGLSK
jgi:metal-responsive CopG/Arc/MetJ family transcriptional regulator